MRSLYPCLALMAACGVSQAAPGPRAFEFAQGVIVDALRAVVYMSNAEARIDAVGLSNGEVIATSTRAAKPLLLYDDVLLASARDRAEALSVVGLASNDLTPKFEVALPLADRVGGGSFYVGARISGNEIIVHWRSIQRPISAIPTHEPAVVTTGFARIDPETGRLIAAAEGEPPAPPTSQREIPVNAQKLAAEGRLASPLCAVDDLVAALQYVEEDGKRHTILRRWRVDTGEGLPATGLFNSEFTFRNFSRDCRDLLASTEKDRWWLWHIYSTTSGKLMAKIQNALPGPEFFVWGDHLIYQSPAGGESLGGRVRVDPPRLVAIKLDDGKELWSRPIGETTYVGPYPGNPPASSVEQPGSERK